MPVSTVGTDIHPPAGTAFALGWLMAQLFDERRQAATARQPSFDPSVQLPLVGDLDRRDRLRFLMDRLRDLLLPFPGLSAAAVTSVPEDPAGYQEALRDLHLRILDDLAGEQRQLSAYQLGLALSDQCWMTGSGGPEVFIGAFGRSQVAGLQALLDRSGAALPPGAAAIVGRSLENWQDWIDVNAGKLRQQPAAGDPEGGPVPRALRVQGTAWHCVLTGDPGASAEPVLRAWAHAAAGVARAARLVAFTIVRRFWPFAVVLAAALGLLLYLVIANLRGAGQAWASLGTIIAFVSGGGFTLGTGVARTFGGMAAQAWRAAELEARAWSVTWLPSLPQTVAQRARLDSRGVALPRRTPGA
jgi:hypothetical protein